VLGEHGFIGLALYLIIFLFAFKYTISTIRRRANAEGAWTHRLARMIQVSLIAFAVGGAALSMAYYDLLIILWFMMPNIAAIASQYVPQPAAKWKAGPGQAAKETAHGKVSAWGSA